MFSTIKAEWVTAIGTVILILMTGVLIWQGFNRPTIPVYSLFVACAITTALIVTAILNYRAAKLRVANPGAHELPPKVFIVSSGQTAWMIGTSITVQLHFISTRPGELVFTRVQLSGTASEGGAWQLDLEDSDPTRIGALEQYTKLLSKKFGQDELKNIMVGRGTSVRGYAKIRFDGEQLARQVQISLNL